MTIQTTASECFKEPFTLDWSQFYARLGLDPESSPITSSVWAITGNGVLGADFITGAETTISVDGDISSVGDVVEVENTIEIQSGAFRDCKIISIKVVT